MTPDTYTTNDQMGRTVSVPAMPQRIISLVPSQTELLLDLGVNGRLVGRTKFCIHPAEAVAEIASVGGTKQFRFDVIEQLRPDLIIGNKEENYKEGILQLVERYPVWMSDIYTLDDALAMIGALGALTNTAVTAQALADQIAASFARLHGQKRPLRTLYLIWKKPFMAAGGDTFINDMLGRCGFENVAAGMGNGRYPELNADDIRQLNPEQILLSSEPFPFAAKHQREIAALFAGTAVRLVDGELFSWYGSRLLKSAAYFESLLSAA